MEELYLGHTVSYWLELQKKIDTLGQGDEKYITEIAKLKGKISFYETRIREMYILKGKEE